MTATNICYNFVGFRYCLPLTLVSPSHAERDLSLEYKIACIGGTVQKLRALEDENSISGTSFCHLFYH